MFDDLLHPLTRGERRRHAQRQGDQTAQRLGVRLDVAPCLAHVQEDLERLAGGALVHVDVAGAEGSVHPEGHPPQGPRARLDRRRNVGQPLVLLDHGLSLRRTGRTGTDMEDLSPVGRLAAVPEDRDPATALGDNDPHGFCHAGDGGN